jgi:hypothetical protein
MRANCMQCSLAFRFALTLMLVLVAGVASVWAQSTAQVPALKADEDEVEVSTFYQGEFDRPTYSLWGPRLACGVDLNAWAQTRCGKRRWIYKPVTNAESGNRCGYRGFALVCFNK